MKSDKIKALIPTEAELCAVFMRDFNALPGWTCYPETGGFDVLVAHDDGRQIGVEAKLVLNAKVADQILPAESWGVWGLPGPDHRLVIVRSITEANAGIAKMLRYLGVEVWEPWCGDHIGRDFKVEQRARFGIASKLYHDDVAVAAPDEGRYPMESHSGVALFDWNPIQRIVLPEAIPRTPAGVPAPVQMTPWKMAAIRVLARLRVQGYITAKEIAGQGCAASTWTQRWLARGPVRGQWIETELTPKLDQQHPELYALALAREQERAAQPFQLET